MEITAEKALLKPFKMDIVAHGCGSVFSALPARGNGCCSQPKAGHTGATSHLQCDNIIKWLSPHFWSVGHHYSCVPTAGEGPGHKPHIHHYVAF